MATKYPIVLVHGFGGFDDIAGIPYFYGIGEALKSQGHRVYTASLSAFNTNEVRGEHLRDYLRRLMRQYRISKVNLISHSQGALASRYMAAVSPDSVASVTSVNGINQGSEIADLMVKISQRVPLPSIVSDTVVNALGWVISVFSGHPGKPQDIAGAMASMTTENVRAFNRIYPQGLPLTPDGNGPEIVNDIRYYSIGSYIQGGWLHEGHNKLDPTHSAMRVLSAFFREKENDGLVGRSSMRLGLCRRDDYAQDHADMVNHLTGMTGGGSDIPGIYTEHAAFLSRQGI